MTDKRIHYSEAEIENATSAEMLIEKKSSQTVMHKVHDRKEHVAKWPLFDIKQPHAHDVLFGRGGGTNHHPGNKQFRDMVEARKVDYLKRSRRDKFLVAVQLVHEWRGQDPPGRFLKRDEQTGLWNDVGDEKAREKTSQNLREGAPSLRRQIGDNTGEPREASPEDVREESQDDLVSKKKRGTGSLGPKQVLVRKHSFGREYLEADQALDIEDFTWDVKKSSTNSRETSPLTVNDVGSPLEPYQSYRFHDQKATSTSTPSYLSSSSDREGLNVPLSKWGQRNEESSSSMPEWNLLPRTSLPSSYCPRNQPRWEYQTFPQQRERPRVLNEGGYPTYSPPYPDHRRSNWVVWDSNGPTYQQSPPWASGAPMMASPSPYLPSVNPFAPRSARDGFDTPVSPNRYNVDPTVASIWSCQRQDEICKSWSTGSGEISDCSFVNPETSTEPSERTIPTKPINDALKRSTSHQCETRETRGNHSSGKKLALNRDKSSTANRLKGLCTESTKIPQGTSFEVETLRQDFKLATIKQNDKPEQLTIEERMTSFDIIEKDLLERPVSLTESYRSSTVEALNLELDAELSEPMPVPLTRSTTMQQVFLEFREGISRTVPFPNFARLSSEDVTELVNEPIDDDGLIETPLMGCKGKVGIFHQD